MNDDNVSDSMPSSSSDAERAEGLELALQLMGANAQGLAWTTNTLIDNLTAERDDLRATLDAVRAGIAALYDGDYMPAPLAVIRALHPPDQLIDAYRPPTDS